MSWACLDDQDELTPRDGGLDCSACGRRYDVVDGIPAFTRNDGERAAVDRSSPLADELWRSMQGESALAAATAFCERHDRLCTPYGPERRPLVALPSGSVAVKIGAGFGDDGDALAGVSGSTVSLVPDLTNARIVARRLQESVGAAWPVAAMRQISRLPLENGSVHLVAMDDISAASFGVTDADFPEAAAEWHRVLAPGGMVLLGLATGIRRGSRDRPAPLNRVLQTAAANGSGRLGLRRTMRTMTGSGFELHQEIAPLPDENDPQLLIPPGDGRVTSYVLTHLIRRNSITLRLATVAAGGLAALGLFRHLLPYRYLLFCKPDGSRRAIHPPG